MQSLPFSQIQTLILSLFAIFLTSIVLEILNLRSFIPVLFLFSIFLIYLQSHLFLSCLESIALSRNVKLVSLVAAFTLASLQIHTFEVLYGFGRAIYLAAYRAGYLLGHSLSGLG